MRDYVIKRISQGILLVIVVSILVFAMLDLMPGDPINIMTDRKVSAEVKEQLRIEYHLNLPLHQRYVIWVRDALHGNFGKSIKSKLPVTDMMKARLPVTLKLTLTALLVELVIAVPIGLLAAYKKDSI